MDRMPFMEIPKRFVVLKPLADVVPEEDTPESVTFLADADQTAGLVVLANYGRRGYENVSIPFVAGCQAIGILPWGEARRENPRAVVGLVDPSARLYVRKTLGKDLFSFSVPYAMFLEMEGNVEGSFLRRGATWRRLMEE